MKFVCDRCKTRYSIADEKVKQKILKIRCKTCENVIVVRDTGASPASTMTEPSPVVVAEVPPLPESSGRPAANVPLASVPLPPPPPRSEPAEWYFSVDGNQQGPFDLVTVARQIDVAKRDDDVFIWREDFDAWKELKEVAVVAKALSAFRSRTVMPSPPAAPRLAPPPPRSSTGGVPTGQRISLSALAASAAPVAQGGPAPTRSRSSASGPTPAPSIPRGGGAATAAAAAVASHGFELEEEHTEIQSVAAVLDSAHPGAGLAGLGLVPAAQPPSRPAAKDKAEPFANDNPFSRTKSPVVPLTAAVAAAIPPSPSAPLFADPVGHTPAAGPLPAATDSALLNLAALPGRGRGMRLAAIGGAVVILLVVVVLFSMKRTDAPEVSAIVPPSPALRKATLAGPEGHTGAPLVAAPPVAIGSDDKPLPLTTLPPPQAQLKAGRSDPKRVGQNRPAAKATAPTAPPPISAGALASADDGNPVARRFADSSERKVSPLANHGSAQAGASVSESEITGVIAKNKPALKACYERGLRHDTGLRAGRMDVTLSIGISGIVKVARVEAPAGFEQVSACVKEVVRRWHFPLNRDEYGTTFPLIFQSSE